MLPVHGGEHLAQRLRRGVDGPDTVEAEFLDQRNL